MRFLQPRSRVRFTTESLGSSFNATVRDLTVSNAS